MVFYGSEPWKVVKAPFLLLLPQTTAAHHHPQPRTPQWGFPALYLSLWLLIEGGSPSLRTPSGFSLCFACTWLL